MFAKNSDYTQSDNQAPLEANGLITNGQMWIGSTATNVGGTHINVGTVTSPDSSVTIGYSSPNITLQVTNPGIDVINGDSGSVSGSTVTIRTDNASVTGGASFKFVNSGTLSTLQTTDANDNTLVGKNAGNLTLSGSSNTGFGLNSLNDLTSGNFNVAYGSNTSVLVTTGQFNTTLGYASGNAITTGSQNTLLGASTGISYTGSETGNILIGNDTRGVVGESYVTRIGNAGNAGSTPQSACYIDGIANVTTSNSEMVTINTSTGQLGSTTIPTSNLSLVSSQTASNSAALTFSGGTITNFNQLFFVMDGLVPVTNAVSLLMEFSQDGGSTWITTSYASGVNYSGYNSATQNNANSTADFRLSAGISNTGFYSGNVTYYSFSTAFFSSITGQAVWSDTGLSVTVDARIGGSGTTGANAVRFRMTSGNISSGTITCFGYLNT